MSRPDVVRTLTLNGFEIRVSVRPGGSGPGEDRRPPLLLCCGIGAGFEAFAPFVDSLDPRIEVIRFDVPGAGASPAGAWPIGFPGHAFLAARILTALGHRRADVLGLSWGGGLAQQLALQHPHRVRRLVLVSTGTGMMMWPGRPQVLGRMLTPRRFRDPEYAASLAGLLYGGSAGWPGVLIFTGVMLLPLFYQPPVHRWCWLALSGTAAATFLFDIGLEVQFGVFLYAFLPLWWWKWFWSETENSVL